ncbi:MAG: PIG-L family deacetylase [Kiritimatiellae bacterium]|nr:PIG-L family deacetylase [Kiritimatiellia bacterium]
MNFYHSTASTFIADNKPIEEAFERITHLGIGAHQDDLEFMAFHGILSCFYKNDLWFGGVTCTNGGGSARSGAYASYTDKDMIGIRRHEQEQAAYVGRYGMMVQLDHSSSAIKDSNNTTLQEDLQKILLATQPSIVYTHNPADKHDTHIGVLVAAIRAIRSLSPDQRPQTVYGCEVWRSLDWMPDEHKILLDVGGNDNLAMSLNGLFDSQIAGGKRYDLATLGRRRANATFFSSHATDEAEQLWFAMDLSPLAHDDTLDITEYITRYLQKFVDDVNQKLNTQLGRV